MALSYSQSRSPYFQGLTAQTQIGGSELDGIRPSWIPTNDQKSAREMAKFKSKIPFDDNMYEVLKTAITLLSKRTTTTDPLSAEEATWLVDAVDLIIEDAKKFGPPPRPVKSDDKSQ